VAVNLRPRGLDSLDLRSSDVTTVVFMMPVLALMVGPVGAAAPPAGAAPPPAAASSVIVVQPGTDSTAPGSLREAVSRVNADGSVTRITLRAGTYALTRCGTSEDGNDSGDLDVRGGQDLALVGVGSVTIRQTCAGERVLDRFGTGGFRLVNVTVTGGSQVSADAAVAAEGGGVRAEGPVELDRASVAANTVTGAPGRRAAGTVPATPGGGASGGGIAAGGPVTLRSAAVTGNAAVAGAGGLGGPDPFITLQPIGGTATGGGVLSRADVRVVASTVSENQTTGGAGGFFGVSFPASGPGGPAVGGGIAAGGVVTERSTFERNVATGGRAQGFVCCSGSGLFGRAGGRADGGAVRAAASVTDTRSTFRANRAVQGEGVEATTATGGAISAIGRATMARSVLDGNEATWGQLPVLRSSGGGLWAGGAVDLTRVTVQGNRGSDGGGVHGGGPVTVANSTFAANVGITGGAIDGDATVAVNRSRVTGNQAQVGGGNAGAGVHADGAASVGRSAFLDNHVGGGSIPDCPGGHCLPGDISGRGGAVRSGVGITANASTFAENSVLGGFADSPAPGRISGDAAGGGLSAPDVALRNVTMHSNRVQQRRFAAELSAADPAPGGAIEATTARLTASTITDSDGTNAIAATRVESATTVLHRVARGAPLCGAATVGVSRGYNWTSDGSCGFGDATDTVLGLDPLLEPLADNGGPVPTRRPVATSPLVDVVPRTHAGCPAHDARGVSRPQGPACDVGAVEVAGSGLPAADLRVITTTDAAAVDAGSPFAITVTATNDGPAPADAVVQLVVPPVVTVTETVASDGGQCSAADGFPLECRWPQPSPVGSSRTVTARATVDADASGPVEVTGSVWSVNPDPDPADNRSTATLAVTSAADLAPALYWSPSYDYDPYLTVNLSNRGPSTALATPERPIEVLVELPPGTEAVQPDGSCQPVDTSRVRCLVTSSIGRAVDGSEAWVGSFAVRATGAVITGSVRAMVSQSISTDRVAANDTTTLEIAELGLTAGRPPGPVAEGAPLPVTVTVTNRGPATARNVQVALQSGPGTVVRATATHGEIRDEDQAYWHLDALTPGATATLRYDLIDPYLQGGSFASGISLRGAATLDLDFRDNVALVDLGSSPEGTTDLTVSAEVRPTADPAQRVVRATVANVGSAPTDARDVASQVRFSPGDSEIVSATVSSPAWSCSLHNLIPGRAPRPRACRRVPASPSTSSSRGCSVPTRARSTSRARPFPRRTWSTTGSRFPCRKARRRSHRRGHPSPIVAQVGVDGG
jgi:hypothetical protein